MDKTNLTARIDLTARIEELTWVLGEIWEATRPIPFTLPDTVEEWEALVYRLEDNIVGRLLALENEAIAQEAANGGR